MIHVAKIVALFSVFCLCLKACTALTEYNLPLFCRRNNNVRYDLSSPYAGTASSGIVRPNYLLSGYDGDSQCSMEFITPSGYRIMLITNYIDLRPNNEDRVSIYSSTTFFPETYYGKVDSKKEFTSSRNITVQLRSAPGTSYGYKGFEFIVTTYSLGSCYSSSLFECNNFRCISDDLTCDGYNHCGDESDQACDGGRHISKHTLDFTSMRTRGAVIVGSVLGSVFLVIIITAGILYCKKWRMADSTTRYITTTQSPAAVVMTVTYPPYIATGAHQHPPPAVPPPPSYQPYSHQQPSNNPNYKY